MQAHSVTDDPSYVLSTLPGIARMARPHRSSMCSNGPKEGPCLARKRLTRPEQPPRSRHPFDIDPRRECLPSRIEQRPATHTHACEAMRRVRPSMSGCTFSADVRRRRPRSLPRGTGSNRILVRDGTRPRAVDRRRHRPRMIRASGVHARTSSSDSRLSHVTACVRRVDTPAGENSADSLFSGLLVVASSAEFGGLRCGDRVRVCTVGLMVVPRGETE